MSDFFTESGIHKMGMGGQTTPAIRKKKSYTYERKPSPKLDTSALEQSIKKINWEKKHPIPKGTVFGRGFGG